ncbi:TRAP-type C4-dicarboxylate transport system permease small subunit [Mesorhizobium sp. J18]|uniref:TRAP transporter small permease subunit n=1 Tax=Mesorhizobium sp. J18 TaxID=935263 RepID=UPI00119C2E16|nr:TRAP transporter small permease [Mesorhizobium sp. J18]TWG98912.1 TRAP-type C4-dicarboxylate transport system permease small subunit [Mesorhizobium sp. J18]
MRYLYDTIFVVSRVAAALACAILVGMVSLILYEIILRYFFASSTYVLDEFVGYGVAACTFLALGYALEHGSLIRVNILLGRTSGLARRLFEAFCAALTMVVIGLFIWFFWIRVMRHWTRGTTSSSIAEMPMWIPEGAVLLGLSIFWLQLLAYLLRQITDTPPPVEQAETVQEI